MGADDGNRGKIGRQERCHRTREVLTKEHPKFADLGGETTPGSEKYSTLTSNFLR